MVAECRRWLSTLGRRRALQTRIQAYVKVEQHMGLSDAAVCATSPPLLGLELVPRDGSDADGRDVWHMHACPSAMQHVVRCTSPASRSSSHQSRPMHLLLQSDILDICIGLRRPSLPHGTQDRHGRNHGKRWPLGKRPRSSKLGIHPVRAGIKDGREPGEPVDRPYKCRRTEGVTSPLALDFLPRGGNSWRGGRTGC
jgi:hypothetical protein